MKKYITFVDLILPTIQIEVDTWEEAEEKAKKLLQRVVAAEYQSTATVHIAPLRRKGGSSGVSNTSSAPG